jgi:hypothetical protein
MTVTARISPRQCGSQCVQCVGVVAEVEMVQFFHETLEHESSTLEVRFRTKSNDGESDRVWVCAGGGAQVGVGSCIACDGRILGGSV